MKTTLTDLVLLSDYCSVGRLRSVVFRASVIKIGIVIKPVRSGSTLRKKLPAALFFGPVLGLSSQGSIPDYTLFCRAKETEILRSTPSFGLDFGS